MVEPPEPPQLAPNVRAFQKYVDHVRHDSLRLPERGRPYPCPCCGFLPEVLVEFLSGVSDYRQVFGEVALAPPLYENIITGLVGKELQQAVGDLGFNERVGFIDDDFVGAIGSWVGDHFYPLAESA